LTKRFGEKDEKVKSLWSMPLTTTTDVPFGSGDLKVTQFLKCMYMYILVQH